MIGDAIGVYEDQSSVDTRDNRVWPTYEDQFRRRANWGFWRRPPHPAAKELLGSGYAGAEIAFRGPISS